MIPLAIGIGVLIVIAVVVLLLKKKRPPVAGADAFRQLLGANTSATSSNDPALNELRQNLRVKLLYQEDKVDAAIEFEREREPSAPLAQLMRAAIARWERENR